MRRLGAFLGLMVWLVMALGTAALLTRLAHRGLWDYCVPLFLAGLFYSSQIVACAGKLAPRADDDVDSGIKD